MLVGGIGAAGSTNSSGSLSGGATSASMARTAMSKVQKLEQDMERVLMIAEALWNILKEKHGYNDTELFRRVAEIDMHDGKLDGKVASEGPAICPHCQRAMIGSRPVCLYCGKPSVRDLFDR